MPDCYYMYHPVNTTKYYILPTQGIYVFYTYLETNGDYNPVRTILSDEILFFALG
jgi:hypothetical protein